MPKKSAGKQPTGRQRKKILLALEPDTAAWLDAKAASAGATRTDTINLLLTMAQYLDGQKFLRIGPGSSVWFKPIPDPQLVKEQVESGLFDSLLARFGADHWPIGIMLRRDGVAKSLRDSASSEQASE